MLRFRIDGEIDLGIILGITAVLLAAIGVVLTVVLA